MWETLADVLSMGGTFLSDSMFSAPYTHSRFPGAFHAFEHLVVIGANVRVRGAPALDAPVLATLSFDVVPVTTETGYSGAHEEWAPVRQLASILTRWPRRGRSRRSTVPGDVGFDLQPAAVRRIVGRMDPREYERVSYAVWKSTAGPGRAPQEIARPLRARTRSPGAGRHWRFRLGIKHIVERSLPDSVRSEIRRQLVLRRGRAARALLERRVAGPAFLGMAELQALQAEFPARPPYGYEPDALKRRGDTRAAFLDEIAAGPAGRRSFELGCWDGMVSAGLRARGWQATAVDLRSSGFDPRAREAGVHLAEMDGTDLQFPDDSFDLSFSYDTFEHVGDPEAVLGELVRVTRPGGTIFLDFGPLYNSPFGLHAYRSVRAPYPQFLFEPTTLDTFCQENGLSPINYGQLNGWSLQRFRALWERFSPAIEVVACREQWNGAGLSLIERFPSCFAAKSLTFEELTVQSIRVRLKVKSPSP